MKVLLTHGYFLEEDVREKQIMRPYPPLGLLYLSAFLSDRGVSNEVFDTTFSSRSKLEQHLLDSRPGIIGIYVNLMTRKHVLHIIAVIRKNLPGCVVVTGGPEVTHYADGFLRHGTDYVVTGEGEETMYELVSSIAAGKPASGICGISYMENGHVVVNPERAKLKDLDLLPFPAREKIDMRQYLSTWKKHHGTSAISISTMRGCPYTCKWCSRAVYGLSYRRRSAAKVVDELISLLNDYSPDTFWFVDDVFTISHKWLREFQKELTSRKVRIRYECITRADRMNEEVVNILKETGCARVWIGAESGSQKVIDLMDRRVRVEQVREMIRLTRRQGIEAGTFIMLGYPGETEADIEETIHHLKESSPDHFTITVAYPIKGTELFQEVEGIQTSAPEWSAGSDREIEFERTYARPYYNFAVRRVVNEVSFSRARLRGDVFRALAFKAKSISAKFGMMWYRENPSLNKKINYSTVNAG